MFSEGLGKNFFKILQNSLSILSQRIFFTAPFKLFGRVFPSHSWECYGAFIIIAQLVNKHKYFWFVMFYSCLLTKMSFYQKKFEVKKCCLAFFYLCLHCRYNVLFRGELVFLLLLFYPHFFIRILLILVCQLSSQSMSFFWGYNFKKAELPPLGGGE